MSTLWSKAQIRQARKIELAPLLTRLGFRLRPLQDGNTLVEDYPDLVVKQHYWTWPSKNLHGNAIDLLVLVAGKSFQQAMQILAEHTCPVSRGIGNAEEQEGPLMTLPVGMHDHNMDGNGNKTREERGNNSKITL